MEVKTVNEEDILVSGIMICAESFSERCQSGRGCEIESRGELSMSSPSMAEESFLAKAKASGLTKDMNPHIEVEIAMNALANEK